MTGYGFCEECWQLYNENDGWRGGRSGTLCHYLLLTYRSVQRNFSRKMSKSKEKIRLLTSPDNPLQPARQASLHVMRKRRDDAPTKSFPNLFLCWVNVPIRLLHPLWIKCPDRWSTLIIETGWDWPPALTWFVFPCFVDLNIGLRIYLEVESRYCA